MNILLTGATGFLGRAILKDINNNHAFELLVRASTTDLPQPQYALTINGEACFSEALENKDIVIHCAARAHVMQESDADALQAYKEINSYGTINLARQAAEKGVKRFIFISTIKVNGERTQNTPFRSNDKHDPQDPYGISKSLAEDELAKIAKSTGLEVVIIRPPLVYGPGVKANFASLLNLVHKGYPLPFSMIKHNKRSMVFVKNLVDLIKVCLDHPNAKNRTFLVSDDDDLSTEKLINFIAQGFGKPVKQFPIPIWMFRAFGKLMGKSAVIDRLIGSLQLDISSTKEALAWHPPYSTKQGVMETAQVFMEAKKYD